MGLDLTVRFSLNCVIQLIHEHTNRPLTERLPRIYTNCQAEIIRKGNGMYAFANARLPELRVRLEIPLYVPEELVLPAAFDGRVRMVRCSPVPRHILGMPPSDVTWFSGKAEPGERVYLLCPVQYCNILALQCLPDGRLLMESTNFLDAATERTVLLENAEGERELVRTTIDKHYPPTRYFQTMPEKIRDIQNLTVLPVFTARADAEGEFLIAVEEATGGNCTLLHEDGTAIREFPFDAGGRVNLS